MSEDSVPSSQVINTGLAKVFICRDGIVQYANAKGAKYTLEEAVACIAAASTLCSDHKRPALIDLASISSVNRDARAYFASQETAKIHTAVALVINSTIDRVIANFFMGFNKPPYPTRLFTSKAEAIKWLKSHLK